MAVAGILTAAIGLLYVLNWLGLTLFLGAMGLRRRRWGTPGGDWMLIAAGLYGLAGLSVVGTSALGSIVGGPGGDPDMMKALVTGTVYLVCGAIFGAFVSLSIALSTAWQAADEAAARRSDGRGSWNSPPTVERAL